MAGEPDDVDTMVEPVVPSRHRRLAELLDARPGDRVADLGCGTGGTLAQAAPAVPGGLVAGLDLSAGALTRTAEAVAEAVAGEDRPPGVLLVQADLKDPLPLATASCDRVVCHNVLEVLPDHGALVAADRAAGGARLAAAADPDPHPCLGHPGPGLGRDHLRGLPGPQDHLGRLRGRPGPRRHRGPLRPRRPHGPGAAAAPPSQGTPAGVHGRGQLDDRQPARAGGLPRPGQGQRRPAVRRRRPRLRGRGERDRSEISPYGRRGNGVVRHLGESYDHVVLTGGFSKAYSSLLAFVACPPELKRLLKVTAPPYLYSGPSPVASLASALVGLQVNEARGDDLRAILWHRTRRVLEHLEKLGAFTLNRSGFPIVEVPLAEADDLAKAGRFLFDQGIYVTLAFYPGVPREEVGFRIQLTAANTDDEVTELLVALDRLADVVPLRPI